MTALQAEPNPSISDPAAGTLPAYPTLQTERLRLRELTVSDVPAMFAIHSDVEAMRWFGTDPLTEFGQAEEMINTFAGWRRLPNPGTRWGIEHRATGELLGSCGLFKWNRGWRSCTLGHELSRPAWGQGFMREALNCALEWGYVQMALNRVEAQVHPENTPSLNVVRGLGFVEEGRLRQAGFWLGEYHDLIQFSLLQRERGAPSAG